MLTVVEVCKPLLHEMSVPSFLQHYFLQALLVAPGAGPVDEGVALGLLGSLHGAVVGRVEGSLLGVGRHVGFFDLPLHVEAVLRVGLLHGLRVL